MTFPKSHGGSGKGQMNGGSQTSVPSAALACHTHLASFWLGSPAHLLLACRLRFLFQPLLTHWQNPAAPLLRLRAVFLLNQV